MNYYMRRFDHKGLNNYNSHCYLYINDNLVIATQAKDNRGTSITNSGIDLVKLISKEINVPLETMIYIEHYEPNTSDKGEEIFWLLDLTSKNAIPERERINYTIVESIDTIISRKTMSMSIKFK